MAQRKRNVQFASPDEPAFIKKLKAQYGLKEGPTINTKNEDLSKSDEAGLEDKDDEQPVIVVLKKGDLSEDEVKQLKKSNSDNEDTEDDGKIVFRKPNKDKLEEKKNKMVQSSYKKDTEKNNVNKNKKESENKKTKHVNNSRLLSFDQDEEDY